MVEQFNKSYLHITIKNRGIATVGPGGHGPPTSSFEPKKVQQFQFQTSGALLYTGVQKLYEPEISRFLLHIVQFLDNLQRLFIFSNNIGEINHFTLDLLKRSDI